MGSLLKLVLLPNGADAHTDCAAVLSSCLKPYRVAAGPRAKFASYRRERAIAQGHRGQRHPVRKVKAHRTKEAVNKPQPGGAEALAGEQGCSRAGQGVWQMA